MTTVNEAFQQEPAGKPAKTPSKHAKVSVDIITTIAWWSLVASLTGIALHRGFGISVPFAPAFILAFTFGAVVKGLAQVVGETWHHERVKADADLIAARMAVQAKLPDLGNVDFGKMFADLGIGKPSADDGLNPYL